MKNEEILKKSRKENNGQDLYEKEVMKTGGEAGFYTVWIFAAVFALLQMLLCREWNYAVFVLAGGFSGLYGEGAQAEAKPGCEKGCGLVDLHGPLFRSALLSDVRCAFLSAPSV